MGELSDLSRRNEELMLEKDNDLAVIRELEAQVKEYKRKYEQAKTELRSAKGLSHIPLIKIHYAHRRLSHYSDIATVHAGTEARRPTACRSRWRTGRIPSRSTCCGAAC